MSVDQPAAVTIIAGMHRSGTSMVTRLLNLCGLSLGPATDIMPPSKANPEGYWERQSMMVVNDVMLTGFGGGWDMPPQFPDGWTTHPDLVPVRTQARRLLATFDGQPAWGWKDPRNSLTLPFWLELLPNAKVLVCLRNPLEVAASLSVRGSSSQNFSLALWLAYNESVLRHTTPQQRVVTHYESYFHDAEAELRRVCGELGLQPGQPEVDAAMATTRGGLRHSRAGVGDLLADNAPAEVVTTYLQLCNEAGPVHGEVLQNELAALDRPLPAVGDVGDEYLRAWRTRRLEALVQELATRSDRSEQQLQGLIGQLSEKEQELTRLRGELSRLGAQQLPKTG